MIVNIRGCNGSGKSTIPMSMMELDPDFEVIKLGVSKTGKPCSPALTSKLLTTGPPGKSSMYTFFSLYIFPCTTAFI